MQRARSRTLGGTLDRALATFPAVLVTGPRQAGKTTFLKAHLAKTHRYISLDAPDLRARATADPVGFLADHPPPVILDEIQEVPALLSYIKQAIDEDRRAGRWVLSGSQVFPVMHGVSESLAGRIAVLTLLPFSFGEIADRPEPRLSVKALLARLLSRRAGSQDRVRRSIPIGRWLVQGAYPELWVKRGVDRRLWMASYVQTYLERDVRSLLMTRDLGTFQTFVRMVALRTAQILNLSEIARDVGVSQPTAKEWLNVLIASHQVALVRPYYRNLGKRLVKSPKVYWLDTGVASWLAGTHDDEAARHGPLGGALFETAVVTAFLKAFHHRGEPPAVWYFRSRDGWEVDLVVEWAGRLYPIEVKATATPKPAHADALRRWITAAGASAADGMVVCDVPTSMALAPRVRAVPWSWV